MTLEEKATAIKNLVKANANKFMRISFFKKDGTKRVMNVHRSKALESTVKGTMGAITAKVKATREARRLLLVQELVKPGRSEHQWRTVNMDTVTEICVNGTTITF